MSRTTLYASKSAASFPQYRIGSIAQTISLAFNNPLTNPTWALPAQKFAALKTKKYGKDFFITEAEMVEFEETQNRQEKDALSYEEMIQEVDSISFGLKSKKDDLEELKRRIARCQAGINAREAQFNSLQKSATDIHSQGKSMMQRFKKIQSTQKHRKDSFVKDS